MNTQENDLAKLWKEKVGVKVDAWEVFMNSIHFCGSKGIQPQSRWALLGDQTTLDRYLEIQIASQDCNFLKWMTKWDGGSTP